MKDPTVFVAGLGVPGLVLSGVIVVGGKAARSRAMAQGAEVRINQLPSGYNDDAAAQPRL